MVFVLLVGSMAVPGAVADGQACEPTVPPTDRVAQGSASAANNTTTAGQTFSGQAAENGSRAVDALIGGLPGAIVIPLSSVEGLIVAATAFSIVAIQASGAVAVIAIQEAGGTASTKFDEASACLGGATERRS